MNKILILYKSKYGTTKQYAKMLKQTLTADIIEITDLKNSNYQNYNVLIFAGSVRVGRINIIKDLQNYYAGIKDKQVIILCVGGAPYDDKNIADLKRFNLKKNLQTVPFFYAQGIVNIDGMKFFDRTLCKLARKMSAKQSSPNTNLFNNKNKKLDEQNLQPLVKYVKALKQN